MVKEFKKELSKLAGIDFFNPKFRDVFKRYFPDDADKEEETTVELERLKEVVGEEKKESDINDNNAVEVDKSLDESVENEEEADAEDDGEGDELTLEESLAEGSAEEISKPEEDATPVQPEANQELVDAKVELELLRAGVREDRLEPAKKLVISEVHSLDDLDKVKEYIKQFPEWLKQVKVNTTPFGMPVGESRGDLTEEEKRLKAMGIDPR